MTDNTNTTPKPMPQTRRLRWSWFPSLLFGDGMLPSVLMLTIVMLNRYGLNSAQTALYISLLGIPFVLRPLFEMMVTHFHGTTKVWILSAEFISAMSLWAIAFTLPTNYWLQGTMCLMPFVVVAGILYNIAMNRFYIDNSPTATPQQKMLGMLFRGVAMLFGIGALVMLAGNMEVVTRNVRYSWSLVFYIMAGVEFFIWLWHSIFLPGKQYSHTVKEDLFGLHPNEYNKVVDTVTHGLRNRIMLYFFVLFVLPEAFMLLATPMLFIDMPHNGGLGLAPQEFGLSFGTIGIIAMFAGCHIGNAAIRRCGLGRWMLPMSIIIVIHGVTMLYLSYNLSISLGAICMATFIGNAAFGFGFTAYLASMERFSNRLTGRVFRRSIAISIMSLTMVMAGMFSGLLLMHIGYRQFFIIAVGLYAATIAVAVASTCLFNR